MDLPADLPAHRKLVTVRYGSGTYRARIHDADGKIGYRGSCTAGHHAAARNLVGKYYGPAAAETLEDCDRATGLDGVDYAYTFDTSAKAPSGEVASAQPAKFRNPKQPPHYDDLVEYVTGGSPSHAIAAMHLCTAEELEKLRDEYDIEAIAETHDSPEGRDLKGILDRIIDGKRGLDPTPSPAASRASTELAEVREADDSSPDSGEGDRRQAVEGSSSPSAIPSSPSPTEIPLDEIVLDDLSLQMRDDSAGDGDQIDNLREAYASESPPPPIVLFAADVSGTYYIGDGWHRCWAVREIRGRKTIPAIVHPGGREAALRHACGANADHGLRRTNADKRKAVTTALREWPDLSNRAIAEICKVSHQFVANMRAEVATVATSTRTGADGKQYPATQPAKNPVKEDGEQIDFWDELNDSYKTVAEHWKKVFSHSFWIAPTVDKKTKLEAVRSLQKNARNTLSALKQREEEILNQED